MQLSNKLNTEQVAFLKSIHAEIMGQQTLERPSLAYALKGLLCELTKPEYMAPSYITEKLNLVFDDVEWTYKHRGEDNE